MPQPTGTAISDGLVNREYRPSISFYNSDISVGGVDAIRQTLFLAICTLAAWLHLKCGLSRATTSRLYRFWASLCIQRWNLDSFSQLRIPYGRIEITPPLFCAMSALDIEPNIIRSICCPKCFSKYSLDSLPQVCLQREVPRAKVCCEKLWTMRTTRAGPRLVPARL